MSSLELGGERYTRLVTRDTTTVRLGAGRRTETTTAICSYSTQLRLLVESNYVITSSHCTEQVLVQGNWI